MIVNRKAPLYLIIYSIIMFQLMSCNLPDSRKKFLSEDISFQKCSGLLNNNTKQYKGFDKEAKFTEKTSWFLPSSEIKGAALVIHGLNNRPSNMNSFVKILLKNNIAVLRVSLKGHTGNYEKSFEVSRKIWLNNIFESYCLLDNYANKNKIPKFFLGYSLGTVSMIDLIISNKKQDINFEEMFLFAPPLKTKAYTKAAKFLYLLGYNWSVPSFNFSKYKINKRTSTGAYKALFDIIGNIEDNKDKFLNLKHRNASIFTHKDDEFLDVDAIKSMVSNLKTNSWKFNFINNDNNTLSRTYNHIIIDKKSLGISNWNKISDYIEITLKKYH